LCTHTYEDIISVENLLSAWQEFIKGKRKKADVQEFQYNLIQNAIELHRALKDKTYTHGGYTHFKIADPKPRDIHKASVCDRLLHHAIYRVLYPYFDTKFIHDSYSCRNKKGTHRALKQFQKYANKVSKNHTKTCWVLKCDIKKFFASTDHRILMDILKVHIKDRDILWLLSEVVQSFERGLPLGNLTSQLFVNIYMHEFDYYVKHVLKQKYYIRYADDFVFLSHEAEDLKKTFRLIERFLGEKLKLEMHPNKVSIRPVAAGVDFLGWVHFPTHRVLRTSSKRKMFRKISDVTECDDVEEERLEAVVQSYLGMLKWGNGWKLSKRIKQKV
jgi:RNA-directed DNA polymerase